MVDAISGTNRATYVTLPITLLSTADSQPAAIAKTSLSVPPPSSIEVISIDSNSFLGKLLDSKQVQTIKKLLIPLSLIFAGLATILLTITSYGRHTLAKAAQRGGIEGLNKQLNLNLPSYITEKVHRYLPSLFSPRYFATYLRAGWRSIAKDLKQTDRFEHNLQRAFEIAIKRAWLKGTGKYYMQNKPA
jgi:hypothetical protein